MQHTSKITTEKDWLGASLPRATAATIVDNIMIHTVLLACLLLTDPVVFKGRLIAYISAGRAGAAFKFDRRGHGGASKEHGNSDDNRGETHGE
jgi:hypothetical protein